MYVCMTRSVTDRFAAKTAEQMPLQALSRTETGTAFSKVTETTFGGSGKLKRTTTTLQGPGDVWCFSIPFE